MTAHSSVCGACAAEVPYGRLSCPSCGELLASVAGSRRDAASVATSVAARPAVPDVLHEPSAAPTSSIVDGQLSLDASAHEAAPPTAWVGSTTTQAAGGAVETTLAAGDSAEVGLLDDEADDLPAWTPPTSTAPWGTASDLNGGRTPSYMPRPGLRPTSPQPAVPPPADPLAPDDEPAWLSNGSHPAGADDDGPLLLSDPEPQAPQAAAAAVPGWPAPVSSAPPAHEPVAEPDIDLLFPPVPANGNGAHPTPAPGPGVAWPEPGAVSWPAHEPVAWPQPGTAAAVAAQTPSSEGTLPAGPAVAAAV